MAGFLVAGAGIWGFIRQNPCGHWFDLHSRAHRSDYIACNGTPFMAALLFLCHGVWGSDRCARDYDLRAINNETAEVFNLTSQS